ncbi:histidyl-tRNA synthase [Cellulophaga lytica]|uniref:Histidine--tRNA ligase n=1 Tax=Cellulophaga lytica (strain ATCC 23178 / DSM 7489 / JCM 8516 / NBRC 14961 / NCIMB 1423 / VKM B-1433 / Cy l20) TaxID=867900 RepID=F0RHN2_CELLC|nr:histidine--tRNA ligase [Cellulophaga lytica]ADY28141.1 Histidyl-tRNA synthetase [Cellulophaga lytica DSM 7489]AIM59216.1 histidyl-tRNA synthase [Cellulophaga lytica]WQG77674.1 histidine--tRNA ligase [Cellulophaga lytica]
MAQKPSIPKGTRDFSPSEIAKRNYIFDIVKKHFQTFGFQPIETPSFENSQTLMGKYGDEGDRLIFKILNSGDYLNKVNDEVYQQKDSSLLTPKISEKALRYDLTVPFARYVVMHQNEIDFPFKRYQIQPVWRADRPQKGRFREFFQCDADVVGSDSLLQEIELVQLYDAVFTNLKLTGTTIKLNNRKILAGIAEVIGAKERLIDFTVALDKLDKIGVEGVTKEMLEKGISEAAIQKATPLFSLAGTNTEQLKVLAELLKDSEEGKKGVEELTFIIKAVEKLGLQSANLAIDVTLARGLNYYTGAIFEVAAPSGVKMGSIGGGGRYDDLTGIFGLKDVSGVGISFGLDRIYLVLEELNLFPEEINKSLEILCVNFGDNEAFAALELVTELRKNGVKADVYPSAVKMQKQMKYANKRNVPYVVLIGEQELLNGDFVVKNMEKGDQQTYKLSNVSEFIASL